ncbi:B/F/G family RNA polymerase sigma-70 factor, partial [Streptomyces sp. NPDC001220]
MVSTISSGRFPTPARTAQATSRRTHDDAPVTADLFARLADLGEGPEREALREELVAAWLPMA